MPLLTPIEDLLATAPQGAADVSASPVKPDGAGFWNTAASIMRQQSGVTTLYERGINERSLPFQKNFDIAPQVGYDPYPELQQSEFSDDLEVLKVLLRAESPEELQFLKSRVRQEQSDRQVISDAGGRVWPVR